jgi:hypothetical protein
MPRRKREKKKNEGKKTIENIDLTKLFKRLTVSADKINTQMNCPSCYGGGFVRRSTCCNAPVGFTSGGLIQEICSKCRKVQHPQMYRQAI